MQELIRDCHESPKAKKAHTQRAWQLFRSLAGPEDRRIHAARPKTARTCASTSICRTIFRWTRRCRCICLDTIPLLDPQAARLCAGPAHAGRVDRGRSGHHPAQTTGQGERPENGGDENGGDGIRPADGGTGKTGIPQAQPRIYLFDLQRLRRPASVGRARKISGPNPSRARCSRRSVPSPITSATTNCSAPRACCCAI